MAITREEFARSLAVMMGAQALRREGDRWSGGDAERGWEFRLAALAPRRIALLELPVTRVDLRLRGYSEDEAKAFVARFELYFRRGGG